MRNISLLLIAACTAHSLSTCGQTPIKPNTDVSSRIVGGTVAVPYSWPWQVVLCHNDGSGACKLMCGGTVIDNRWVMTSGFCASSIDMNPSDFMIKAAVFEEDSTTESGEQIVAVKSINLHPQFQHFPTAYDIALFELATPLTFNDHVQPICLVKNDTASIKPGNLAWSTGWGETSLFGDNSAQLRQVQVPFVDFEMCAREDEEEEDEEVMLCAGRNGHDACTGDGGGPLAIQGPSGAWFQLGIVAYGNEGCGMKEEPGIYSRVQAYCDFIEKTTKGTAKCQDIV